MIAAIGPSGCGKTTLMRLIAKIYDAKCGSVRIDGADVRDIALGDVRNFVSLTGQQPALFRGSINGT